MVEDISIKEFKSKVGSLGGFESIKFSPHMRFRAGQRRMDWEGLKEKLRSGDIEDVELNRNPNRSIPYEEAYVIFLSLHEHVLIVPFYILEDGSMKDGSMKAVTVMVE